MPVCKVGSPWGLSHCALLGPGHLLGQLERLAPNTCPSAAPLAAALFCPSRSPLHSGRVEGHRAHFGGVWGGVP